jgi:Protein of unknown function (DUF1549)/Protein of unknown function (DUF1553)
MRTFSFLLSALAGLLLAEVGRAADLLPATLPIHEVVDTYVDALLKEQKVDPAPLADEATLLRRLTLDLVGRIPTASEFQAYLSSTDPDKKAKLVDRLMASSGFLRHQVNELDALLATAPVGSRRGGGSMRDYLTLAVKENRPWDRIYRELLIADESDPSRKGSSQFLKSRVKDLDRLTTEVSILFFGVNISCAQCHDHPLVQDWKQEHYYGLKAFFAPTFEAGQRLGEKEPSAVAFKSPKGVAKSATLRFLTGDALAVPSTKPLTPAELKKAKEEEKKRAKNDKTPPTPPKFSARAALVEASLKPEARHFFARAFANRMWYRFFGLGLVSPTDQMHSENLPSHPELLEWLARDAAEHGYDLRRMIRGLVLSKTYARSSRQEGDKKAGPRSFAVARLRALTPMQLATSLRIATADPDQLGDKVKPDEVERRIEQYENAARGFSDLIEQPRDDFQISVTEALLFSNSDRLQREMLADGRDRLVGKLKELKNPEEAVEVAIRNVLTRSPAPEEKKALVEYLAQRRDRLPEAYRQMVWALLTSAEFRFNY